MALHFLPSVSVTIFGSFHFLVPCYCDGKHSRYCSSVLQPTNICFVEEQILLWVMFCEFVKERALCTCWTTVAVFVTQISLVYSVTHICLIALNNLCPVKSGVLKALSSCISVPTVPGMISHLLYIFRHIHCYCLLMNRPFHCIMIFIPCCISFSLKVYLCDVHTVSCAVRINLSTCWIDMCLRDL